MPTILVHPLAVRITHWINALAVLMMITSGWQIYNASPLFPFTFPHAITLGGWLAGALQWHFAAMWLLVLNGIVYVSYGLASGHFRRRLLPISPGAVGTMQRQPFLHGNGRAPDAGRRALVTLARSLAPKEFGRASCRERV